MKWQIEYRQDVEIISTVVSGAVTLEGVKKVSTELLELAKQKAVSQFLTSFRDISNNISIFEIYNLPKTLRDLGINTSDKIAIVYPMNSPFKSLFSFFDTRCFNSSLNVKVFPDYEIAYNWLIGSDGLNVSVNH